MFVQLFTTKLYHKFYGEEKRLLCTACLMLGDNAQEEKANMLLQQLRLIGYRNLQQRYAYGALN